MLLNKKDVDQKKADAWSIGVMLYQLLLGEHPFEKPVDLEEGSVKRTLQRILKVLPQLGGVQYTRGEATMVVACWQCTLGTYSAQGYHCIHIQ